MSVPLARVYRGSEVESVHRGSIAVVDSDGRLLAMVGDPALRTCLRSAAKPFQAIPLLEYGGVEEFELTGEEIALTAASHGGEPVHVATAAALLRKGEFDEEDLLCAAHLPLDEKSSADLRAAGDAPSVLHNNCSGKHAGMLLATRVMDVPSAEYIEASHPLQQLMRTTLGEFAGVRGEEIAIAIDGCGVPAFYLPRYRAALAYARLMALSIDRYAESGAKIIESMTSHAHFVAGNWSITTPLIDSYDGDLLAKEGAEGFYAIALSPSLALEAGIAGAGSECAVGIALKIEDGSMERGRNPAILRLLDLLGLDPGSRTRLQPFADASIRNHAGTMVGKVRSEFDLEML